jgi:quinoprotein glucose dehydrogenase
MKQLACGLVIAAGVVALLAQEGAPRSVWDGVYTVAQADRGRPLYLEHCEDCHGQYLEGDAEAPALAGGLFATNWNGLPLGQLFLRMRRDMPADHPGTVSAEKNADILAYMLRENGFPSGRTELPHSEELLNQIRFESARPQNTR